VSIRGRRDHSLITVLVFILSVNFIRKKISIVEKIATCSDPTTFFVKDDYQISKRMYCTYARGIIAEQCFGLTLTIKRGLLKALPTHFLLFTIYEENYVTFEVECGE
jgi:hypothetical protein